MSDKIEYGVVPVSKSQEISDFLLKHFFPNEPISRVFGLPNSQVERWFGMQIQDCLKQQSSIQAVDGSTGELVGVAINILVEKKLKSEIDVKEGEEKEGRGLLEILDPEKEAIMVKIAKFLGVLNQVPDNFYKSGADANGVVKTFNCIYLAVSPSCGGKGIARRLLEESEKIGRKSPAAFLQVDTTSDFSFRIFHLHLKYEIIREIDLAPYIPGIDKIDNGAHKKGRILLKKI